MGGVLDGQAVSAAVTNPAFLDANGDDTGIGKITLANTDPVSGSSVTNLQREHNSAASFMGKALNSVFDDLPIYVNNDVGSANDPLLTRADALTAKFNATTGHTHTGAAGDAPQITASDLASVPLRGYVNQGVDLSGVTGSSVDVSTELAGKTAGGSALAVGVVTTGVYNKVLIRQASGTDEDDVYKDASGNVVYARVTESSGVWTLSFYVNLSGTETAYSFASASDVRWYYQEIYNPMVSVPTYSEFAVVPSDNQTADVVTATTGVQGKVLLASAAAQDVSSSSGAGTANGTVANADHTHRGVSSLAFSSALYGDVTLTGSGTITLSQVGQNIDVYGIGALGKQETPAGVVNGVNATFGPLSFTPTDGNSVIVFVDFVAVEQAGWSLVGNSIVFNAGYIPVLGQSVYVFYLTNGIPPTPPTPANALQVEYRTLTSGEIAAGSLTLAATPANGNFVIVDLIGGSSQQLTFDFTVAGATLSWLGLGLAGVVSVGSVLRVQYFT